MNVAPGFKNKTRYTPYMSLEVNSHIKLQIRVISIDNAQYITYLV